MNERTYNLPGKLSAEELEQIRKDAEAVKMKPAAYVRKKLKLPAVAMGAPKGNQNAVKEQADAK